MSRRGPYSRAVAAPAAAPRAALIELPEVTPAALLAVGEVFGVWCVVDAAGRVLAPCASKEIAERHADGLSRLPSFSK